MRENEVLALNSTRPKFFQKENFILLSILLFGCLTRFIVALYTTPWNGAPDHLAWEMLLEEAIHIRNLRYDQLIHYPHEGGTILISIVSLIFKLFGVGKSLVYSAFLFDLTSRAIQLLIIRKLFDRTTYFIFGIWTIFGLPTILPWASVNFGLHSLVSFSPFILLLLLSKSIVSQKQIAIHGLILGALFWISYSNIILIPIYTLYQWISSKNTKYIVAFFASFSTVFLIHIAVRSLFDAGFHIAPFSALTIRGLNHNYLFDLDTYKQLYQVWYESLPGSSGFSAILDFSNKSIRFTWLTLMSISLVSAILSRKSLIANKSLTVAIITSTSFLLLYAISPFYEPRVDRENLVFYRHLTYILPILSLTVLSLLLKSRITKWATIPILVMSVIGFYQSYHSPIEAFVKHKESGWVVGFKLGDQPTRIQNLASNHPKPTELMEGIGWGTCTAILLKKDELEIKRSLLYSLSESYSDTYREQFLIGAKRASNEMLSEQDRELFLKE